MAAAKRKLAEGGRPNGFSMTLRAQGNSPTYAKITQLVQAQLKEVGIDAQIQFSDFATLLRAGDRGDFDALTIGWSGRIDPDGNVEPIFQSKGAFNYGKYNNKEVDALIERGQQEQAQPARKKIYQQIAKLIDADAAYAFTYFRPSFFMSSQQSKDSRSLPTGSCASKRSGWLNSVIGFVLRRLVATIPTLFVVSLVIFTVIRLAPGDPAQMLLGEDATPESLASLRQALGLDKSLPVQYLAWMSALFRGDMGRSLATNQPVVQAIAERLPVTLELALFATILAVAIGIPLGVIAAMKRNTPIDLAATGVALIGVSLPTFVFGLLGILVFALWLRVLPPSGYTSPWLNPAANLRGMIMPSIVLGAALAGVLARLTRSGMLETLGADFVRTARAKGLPERAVTFKHALRNAILPVVTILGLEAGALLGGAIITETVFTLPGVGKLVVDAILSRDFPTVQAAIIFLALARIAANLAADLTFAALDPRIHYA